MLGVARLEPGAQGDGLGKPPGVLIRGDGHGIRGSIDDCGTVLLPDLDFHLYRSAAVQVGVPEGQPHVKVLGHSRDGVNLVRTEIPGIAFGFTRVKGEIIVKVCSVFLHNEP
jgi:hypothetical protein